MNHSINDIVAVPPGSAGGAPSRKPRRLRLSRRLVCALVTVAVLGSGQVFVRRLSGPAWSPARTDGELDRPVGTGLETAIPVRFEENRGQTDPRVKFVSRGSDQALLLTPDEMVMRFSPPGPGGNSADVLRMRLVGGADNPRVTGEDRLSGVTNYLMGSDPGRWATEVAGYGRVRYHGVYPGIDFVFYGRADGDLEYDFVVEPRADPGVIRMSFAGSRGVSVGDKGDLLVTTAKGMVRHRRPVVYQQTRGGRSHVEGAYVIEGEQVGFRLGTYDRSQALVIDPVLTYSTYLGGSNEDAPSSIAVDNAGNLYVTGRTASIDFPGVGSGYDTTCGTDGKCNEVPPDVTGSTADLKTDVFVTKITPDGSMPRYSTYLGGAGVDAGVDIAVDAAGNAFVVGHTSSPDFPTTANAFDRTCGTDGSCDEVDDAGIEGNVRVGIAPEPAPPERRPDGFVAKLGPTGSTLLYSTFLGGKGNDLARSDGASYEVRPGVAVEPGHERQASTSTTTGITDSGPNPGPAAGIALDSTGVAYVTGATMSPDFPTTPDGLDRTCGTDGTCNQTEYPTYVSGSTTVPRPTSVRIHPDSFVVQLDTTRPGGDSLVYGTFLGGGLGDVAHDIAVGYDSSSPDPQVYLTGFTYSPSVPASSSFPTTPGAFRTVKQVAPATNEAGAATTYDTGRKLMVPFVVRIDPMAGLAALRYSSFLGGLPGYMDRGVAVAASGGQVYVAATVASASMPTRGMGTSAAFQPALAQHPTNPAGKPDGVIARFNTSMEGDASLVYMTYLGGVDEETLTGIALDPAGRAHVSGRTSTGTCPASITCSYFPVKDPLQTRSPAVPCQYVGGNPKPVCYDAALTVLEPDGGSLAFSTHLRGEDYGPGGSPEDTAASLATWTDPTTGRTETFVVGRTRTRDLPTVDSFSEASGYGDGFLARISPVPPARPLVAAVEPKAISGAGGAEVVVTGTGLAGATQVTFGGVAAPTLRADADGRRLVAVAPPGQGKVEVRVRSAEGISPRGSITRVIYQQGQWTPAPSAAQARWDHTATMLDAPACRGPGPTSYPCGQVLMMGGSGPSNPARTGDLFNPGSGSWSSIPDAPSEVRHGGNAMLLADGRVLFLGSSSLIYDPSARSWTTVTSSRLDRQFSEAILLSGPNCGANCGKVLVVGGGGQAATVAELYDPMSGTWALTGFPAVPRKALHTLTMVTGNACSDNCGKVLLVGGITRDSSANPQSIGVAELYDPARGEWVARDDSLESRYGHSATLLPSGKVVIAGGINGLGGHGDEPTSVVEVFDPSESFDSAFSPGPRLLDARSGHGGVTLAEGRVMVIGGGGDLVGANVRTRPPLASAEVLDLDSGSGWSITGPMATPRGFGRAAGGHSATVLGGLGCGERCGQLLVFGGAAVSDQFGTAPVGSDVREGALSSAEYFTAGPHIASVSPAEGSPAGGTEVVIEGSGFVVDRMTASASVTIGGRPAVFRVESAGRIVATVPPMTESADVEVQVVASGLGSTRSPFVYREAIGPVGDLVARALSGTEILLTFRAPGLPPADTYVVKQSRSPIDDVNFDDAQSVCSNDLCTFVPLHYREPLTVGVSELTPETTYYYAVRPLNANGTPGPISNLAMARTSDVTPGVVTDLVAISVSEDRVRLDFSAPGSNGTAPPPARRFVIKQSILPIGDAQAFERADTLCGGVCEFGPTEVGERLSLTVSSLERDAVYHYAMRALDEAGNAGPISVPTSASPACPVAGPAGANQVVYPAGYRLVGLPGGTRVPTNVALFGWFNLGKGGRYSTTPPDQAVEAGRGYWAWFGCPRLVNLSGTPRTVSMALDAFKASMVGNPSSAPSTVKGHDYAARWDSSMNNGSGGYRISDYRAPVVLAPGEGAWVFSYVATTIVISPST